MLILDHVPDLAALLGFMAGAWLWHSLASVQRSIVAFLGVSAFCGAGQFLLHVTGYSTAWFGNVWDLSVLVALIGACLNVMRSKSRYTISALRCGGVTAWVTVNLLMGGLMVFNDDLSLAIYGILALSGALLLSQFMDDSVRLMRKPEFILGLVCLGAGLMDAINSISLSHYHSLGHSFVVNMMMARNAVWLLAYGMLTYSLTLEARKSRKGATIATENPHLPFLRMVTLP